MHISPVDAVAYYPKNGEFFYVKTKCKITRNIFERIGCRDNVKGLKNNVLHSSMVINKNSRFFYENKYVCSPENILELRPATEEEIQRLKDKVKVEYNKEWNGKAWNSSEWVVIKKTYNVLFEKWIKENVDVVRRVQLYSSSDNCIEKKLNAYTQLYLFAQWQNSINKLDTNYYYIKFTKNSQIETGCGWDEDYSLGQIRFNSRQSAQLAIDVLGEDLIKAALSL